MMNNLSGRWVFDSNLFIYFIDKSSPFVNQAKALFGNIISGEIKAYCGQQNIVEVERILIQKYHISVQKTISKIDGIIKEFSFQVLTPIQNTMKTFHSIIPEVAKGEDLFDYYLSATMLDNGINRILTVNIKDFSKIPGIEAVNPFKEA